MKSKNKYSDNPDTGTCVGKRLKLRNTIGLVVACGVCSTSAVCAGEITKKPIISFGMVTDAHYAARPGSHRAYNESLAKMTECVTVMNEKNVDFLIQLGELIDKPGELEDASPSATEAAALEALSAIAEVFAQFKGPRYHVLGNHDMGGLSKAQFMSGLESTGIDKDATYYSFSAKGIHFVVLDGCFNEKMEPYEPGNFTWKDSWIPPEQIEWLRQDLASTDKPVIVFVHQPLAGNLNHMVKNAEEVRKVLEADQNVLAVFTGHDHRGQYDFIEGIHYYTLKAMVEGSGAERNAYAIVEVYADNRMVITGYREAESDVLIEKQARDVLVLDWEGIGSPPKDEREWRYTLLNPVPGETYELADPNSDVERFRYIATTAAVKGWYTPGFDDSAWKSGKAPIGKGTWSEDGVSISNQTVRGDGEYMLMRTSFEVDNLDYGQYRLNILCNDAYIVYLNGHKIYTYVWWRGDPRYRGIAIDEQAASHLKLGENLLAVYVRAGIEKEYAQIDVEIEGLTEDGDRNADKLNEARYIQEGLERAAGITNVVYYYNGDGTFAATSESDAAPPSVQGTASVRSVMVMSDLHIGNKNQVLAGDVFLSRALEDVQKNLDPIHYALLLGDITQHGDAESLEKYLAVRNQSSIPQWFELAGNHDYYRAGITNYTKLIRSTAPYMVLDGNIAWFIISSDKGGRPGYMCYSTYAWLKKNLALHEDKITIVSSHQMPADKVYNANRDELVIHPKDRVADVLATRAIDLWMFGHEHHSPYTEARRIRKNNTTFINVASMSHAYGTGESQSYILEFKQGEKKILARRRSHDAQSFTEAFDMEIPLRTAIAFDYRYTGPDIFE